MYWIIEYIAGEGIYLFGARKPSVLFDSWRIEYKTAAPLFVQIPPI